LWTAQSRLPDFSWAGYHSGEDPLPDTASWPRVNVKDFGATGDGRTDDAPAFRKAIASVDRGVVFVPAGRYRIEDFIEIQKSNVVLKGAGADRTTLFCPKPLNEIRPNWGATTSGERTSNYSWSGGFVSLRGETGRRTLATVTLAAKRGERSLQVSSAAALHPGDRVQINQTDDARRTLSTHLYSDDPGPMDKLGGTRTSQVSRIQSVAGNTITMERPLRTDVRPEWHPLVVGFQPTVTESGVEDLNFEFPPAIYNGHFTELGFNAVSMNGVADCWVRNIRITNPDSGIFISGVFNTVDGVTYESVREPSKVGQPVGHHGVYLGGNDNLFTRFDFRMKFIHDLSLSTCSGNVYSNGKGVDLTFDHHKRAPYENLYTNIDAGAGTRLWTSGGGDALGRHCGARGTFWNIRAKRPLRRPPPEWGPASMNLVAFFTDLPSSTQKDGLWIEPAEPGAFAPSNLHEAQLARRMRGRKK